MRKETGYIVGRLVGTYYEGNSEYLMLHNFHSSTSPCNECCFRTSSGNCSNDNESESGYLCKRNNYFYKKNAKVFNYKRMVLGVDMMKLSESCRDICMYFGKNCYNKSPSCFIRLLESMEYKLKDSE